MDWVCLRFWHGGLFKSTKNGTAYVGGEGKTYPVDPDELCWFFLEEMAKECGGYRKIEMIYYLKPGCSLDDGLKRVYDDAEVRTMTEIVEKSRSIDLFVLHGVDEPDVVNDVLLPLPQPTQDRPQKLIPRRAPLKPDNQTKDTPQEEAKLKKVAPKKTQSANFSPTRSSPRFLSKKNTQSADVHIDSTHQPILNAHDNPSTVHIETNKQPTPQKLHTPSKEANHNISHPHTSEPAETVVNTQTSTANHHIPDEYWNDPRPDSDSDEVSSGSDSDPLYEPEGRQIEGEDEQLDELEGELEGELEDELEGELEGELEEELDDDEVYTSDEEYLTAKNRVKVCKNNLLEIVEELRKQADEGFIATNSNKGSRSDDGQANESGYMSEYENSEDEIHTPEGSDGEVELNQRRSRRSVAVDTASVDFRTFQWKVGQRFPNRESFKQAVASFAIMQGRNLRFNISNKKRGQRLGACCIAGCPFKLYSSWDSRRACFVVKTIQNEHTCCRNMKKNIQLKSTWAAQQLLEVFKSRPHWPASEIKETIRRAYRVVVSRDFAYKTKREAHKLLHGSMVDHYNKLGRYIQALRVASPESHIVLLTDSSNEDKPPVFQRLFMGFDGLKKGWIEGCKRVICIDACFLKTFLGGQLMAAVGRDGNDQMYPIAWAVVEGENTSSWEWFITELQVHLQLEDGDGDGLAILSDENQVSLRLHIHSQLLLFHPTFFILV